MVLAHFFEFPLNPQEKIVTEQSSVSIAIDGDLVSIERQAHKETITRPVENKAATHQARRPDFSGVVRMGEADVIRL